jgi:hypothetical protein
MMMKSTSPFAGLKLTEQAVPSAGPDQRLFAPSNQPPPPPSNQGISQATLQARKVGTKEPRNLGNQPAGPSAPIEKPLFDLSEAPYRNDTFAFTDQELDAIEDLKLELRRKHDIRATKNSLVRCAVHVLIEDYKQHGAQSVAARRLRRSR